jgi:hypothetical protein
MAEEKKKAVAKVKHDGKATLYIHLPFDHSLLLQCDKPATGFDTKESYMVLEEPLDFKTGIPSKKYKTSDLSSYCSWLHFFVLGILYAYTFCKGNITYHVERKVSRRCT